MGPGEGGSQGGALLQHGPDFSFPAGVLGSVELVLASQGPVQDPKVGQECRQKETRGHCPGCWVGSDWWELGVKPRSLGLIRAKLGFFQANSPARQLTLALNEAVALETLSYGPDPTLISGHSLAFF